MSRIRIREPPLPRTSSSGPSGVADFCLRAVEEFPLVALETHPPRAGPPVNLLVRTVVSMLS